MTSVDDFVRNYLAEMADTTSESIDQWEHLDGLIEEDPEQAWLVLQQLSESAPEQFAARIAVGPLEEFLVMNESFIERVIAYATENPRFQQLLKLVEVGGMTERSKELLRQIAQT